MLPRRCTRCLQEKPLSAFFRHYRGTGGYQANCKACWKTKTSHTSRASNRRHREKNLTRFLWSRAKYRAEKMGLAFDIDVADIIVPPRCPILGIELRMAKNENGGPDDHSPSLDRINPALGYVKGNVSVISNRANRIKTDATPEILRRIVAYISPDEGEGNGWA